MNGWWNELGTWMESMRESLLGRERSVARQGEDEAAKFLRSQGYGILIRNYRNKLGEIDIVAASPDQKSIVIVEVKAAVVSSESSGRRKFRPEDHVNRAKERKLTRLGAFFAKDHGYQDKKIRFDVIGVDLENGKPPIVRHHVNAFQSYF